MWVGGNGVYQMQIRVPDRRHPHVGVLFYTVHAPEGAGGPDQMYRCVDYEYEWIDDKGKFIVDYIEGQDIMAWVSQGADRRPDGREHHQERRRRGRLPSHVP
jgi:5,5'-dehydrodivanillate O-demethylase oxygenase subunit